MAFPGLLGPDAEGSSFDMRLAARKGTKGPSRPPLFRDEAAEICGAQSLVDWLGTKRHRE